MLAGRASCAAIDVAGAGDGEGVLRTELALVARLVVELAGETLVTVAGTGLGVSSVCTLLSAVDVGSARDCEGVHRTVAALGLRVGRAVQDLALARIALLYIFHHKHYHLR